MTNDAMMQAELIDSTLAERMVLGFREQEAHFEGYETKSCERGVNCVVWELEYTTASGQDNHTGFLIFEDTKVIVFQWPVKMYEGDMLKLTYKLSWHWEGGGEEYTVLPAGGGAGLELEMVFSLSA